MNPSCSSTLNPVAPPAPSGLARFLRLLGPMALDLTHALFIDRPHSGTTPRTVSTHYR